MKFDSYIIMNYQNTTKTDVDDFSNDNFKDEFEEGKIKKRIPFQDPDENFGRMAEFFNFLKICDNQLKSSIEETNYTDCQ